MANYDLHEKAAAIVSDAGGELVGRTRLQKVAYLTQLAGFMNSFDFEYKHYGPFSDDLATAIRIASGLKLVSEEERQTNWGGWYSVFRSQGGLPTEPSRSNFVSCAASIGAIELELAATAAYLFVEEKIHDPWSETAKRKAEKAADGRLERAKAAYRRLMSLETPNRLPPIV